MVTIITPDTSVISRKIEDYPEGIIIPINKPYRWTSADVIRKVKFAAVRHFAKKKLKVGHAGTLDPLATGVLLVCIGPATKLAESLQAQPKEYIAGIAFGATTPSYDLEKEIDRFFPHKHITKESIEAVLPEFLGEQNQVAPLFSAKTIDGVRAYELARELFKKRTIQERQSSSIEAQGIESSIFDATAEEVIRVSRINITELELVAFGKPAPVYDSEGEDSNNNNMGASSRINVTNNSALGLPRADIRIACSKGTYVRAFARDLGEALNSGAHLDFLQRSQSGGFRVENCLSVSQTINLLL